MILRSIRGTAIGWSLVLAVILGPATAAADRNLRIGVITPLSGSIVGSGESVRDAVILADSLFDKSNLVDFAFEDDGFQPRNSVTAAKRFIAEKKDAVIVFGTPTASAVVPITEQAELPLAAITIVDRVVAGRKFAVRHFVAWQEENARLIAEVKRRGYRRIAVVATINDATLSLRDGFLKDAPVEIVLNEEFARDNTDFQAVAAKIKNSKPDAVYHLLFAPQGSVFMKSLRQMGCNSPVFAAHNVEDPSEIAAADGAYEGIWFVTGDDRAGNAYLAAYRQRFGKDPAMGWANAFDLAKMIIESASANASVMTYFKQLQGFQGVFGTYGAAPGNTFDLKAVIKTIRGGRLAAE